MGVSNLIEDIRISSGHVGNNQIGLRDLVVNPIKYAFVENLFVDAFRLRTSRFAGFLDPDFVDVVKLGTGWHQYEAEWLWRSCFWI